MEFQITDYNNSQTLFNVTLKTEWEEIKNCISNTEIYLKASDQKGKIGSPIFDPVGTNKAIRTTLTGGGWKDNLEIPGEFSFLGTDIDFEKKGIIVEVQFSNYPFLLNNILRSELFFRAKIKFDVREVCSFILITKAGKFPSSNSTLYYEQAKNQLDSFIKYQLFSIPVRLVGLFPKAGTVNKVKWTKYDNPRYSRTIEEQTEKDWYVEEGKSRYGFSKK